MERKEKGSGNGWSFILSMVFGLLVAIGIYYLLPGSIHDLRDIHVFEFIILALAVFRLTRLLVYDKVAQYIRDLFLNTEEEHFKGSGMMYVVRTKPATGFRRLMSDLFSCPWCIGVWSSLFTVFIYFKWPETWFIWLLLAVAGVSSFVQLTINLIGWHAEHRKLMVKNMDK